MVRTGTEFHDTTLERVEKDSGPALGLDPGQRSRYQVYGVRGFAIQQGQRGYGGSNPPGTTWSVLDSHDCWRDVASFTNSRWGYDQACNLRDDLNRDHRKALRRKD